MYSGSISLISGNVFILKYIPIGHVVIYGNTDIAIFLGSIILNWSGINQSAVILTNSFGQCHASNIALAINIDTIVHGTA